MGESASLDAFATNLDFSGSETNWNFDWAHAIDDFLVPTSNIQETSNTIVGKGLSPIQPGDQTPTKHSVAAGIQSEIIEILSRDPQFEQFHPLLKKSASSRLDGSATLRDLEEIVLYKVRVIIPPIIETADVHEL